MSYDNTPNRLESAFIQRDTTNAYYEQVNFSGSDLVIYHDENGLLTADKVLIWAAKYGIGAGGQSLSASWASASYQTQYATQSLYSTNSISASWASASIFAIIADTASFASHSITAIQSFYSTESISSSYSYFDGNRKITRGPYSGINLGTDNVVNFLNAFFFPFVSAAISINSTTIYYETGSSQNISIYGTITANSETIFGSGSVRKNGDSVYTFSSASSYSTTENGVSSSRSYQTFMQVGNNGSPTLIVSSTKTVSFLYPYLWGMNTVGGLSGIALYNGLSTKTIETQQTQADSFIGTSTYIYFAFPATYGNLTSIKDPNNFEVLSSFEFSSSVPITSSGLTNTWMALYKVYRLTLQASPNGTYTFYH